MAQVGNFQEAAATSRYQLIDRFNQLPELGAATSAGNRQWERFGAGSTADFDLATGNMRIGTAASNGATVALFPRSDAGLTRLRGQPFTSRAMSRFDVQLGIPAAALADDVTIAIGFAQTEAADLTTDDNHGLCLIQGGELSASIRQDGMNVGASLFPPQFSKAFVTNEYTRLSVYFAPLLDCIVFLYNGQPFAYQNIGKIDPTVTLRPIVWISAPGTNTEARQIGMRCVGVGGEAAAAIPAAPLVGQLELQVNGPAQGGFVPVPAGGIINVGNVVQTGSAGPFTEHNGQVQLRAANVGAGDMNLMQMLLTPIAGYGAGVAAANPPYPLGNVPAGGNQTSTLNNLCSVPLPTPFTLRVTAASDDTPSYIIDVNGTFTT